MSDIHRTRLHEEDIKMFRLLHTKRDNFAHQRRCTQEGTTPDTAGRANNHVHVRALIHTRAHTHAEPQIHPYYKVIKV